MLYGVMPDDDTTIMEVTQEERDVLKQTFDDFDKDGNGQLDISELAQVLTAFSKGKKPSDAEVSKIFAIADKDKNGTIEFEEFLSAMCQVRVDKETELRGVFQSLDQDGNGFIDTQELVAACAALGMTLSNTEVALLLETYDTNGDGKIDFYEFCELIKSL